MEFDLHDSVTVQDTANKYIFWDIDGTLTPYRFNGHVGDPNGTPNGQSLREIENGIFYAKQPSKQMQSVLKTCQAKKHIVMGHCCAERELTDKHQWLKEHYPMISDVLLESVDISKADTILNWCQTHQVPVTDVIFVDDVIPFLREAERKGIKAYHVTSFLDWMFQFTTK